MKQSNKRIKTISFSLVVAVLMLSGCTNEHNEALKKPSSIINPNTIDKEQIAKAKAEIYSELKKINGSFYKSILGVTLTDDVIADYNKINLLSVKIVKDINNYKIKISYDESLLKTKGLTAYLKPIYKTAYDIAEKNKIFNPDIEFYINNKSLDSF